MQDEIPSPGVDPCSMLDTLAGQAMRLSPLRYLSGGWGDRDIIANALAFITEYRLRAPPHIDVRWDGPPRLALGATLRQGWFPSPGRRLGLAPESLRARFQMLWPAGPSRSRRPPLCLVLAATGEESLLVRRWLLRPLLRQGIGLVVLEHPFYGSRRPPGQTGPFLRTVADLLLSFVSAAEEGSALLHWLHRRGHEHLGITGYSQGGYLASFAAAMTPFPVAAVPCASGDACGDAYARGKLSRIVHWTALRKGLPRGADPREALLETLAPVRLTAFPVPRAPEAAIIVFPEADGFVRREQAEALHRHWAGSTLRRLPGGHLSGYLQGPAVMRGAVLDAFRQLQRAPLRAAVSA